MMRQDGKDNKNEMWGGYAMWMDECGKTPHEQCETYCAKKVENNQPDLCVAREELRGALLEKFLTVFDLSATASKVKLAMELLIVELRDLN